MNTLDTILNLPEGRRLEFKESLPASSDLSKTIIAFSNDAGGDLYIGVKDNPRRVIGLKEEDLISIEEKISSIVHDNCKPVILPDIKFIKHNGKHLVKVTIYRGNNLPYYIKTKGIKEGTYIRVGSTNRLADAGIIAELERQRSNISFDSELSFLKTAKNIDLHSFNDLFVEKTSQKISLPILKKLELFRENKGRQFPTNSLILISDDSLRRHLFPYAKIECARFKGTVPGDFIDQKTIEENICLQPELAYQFVLRHISEGTADYNGVYRKNRWEYPVIAIREVIRNAVIHRDYSISGSDIEIAIFDDKIEITSPGKLPTSVDYNDMESGQSQIRNKTLAPVFKLLGIIEQWGNGLQLIKDELKKYPGIALEWKEPGMFFRVTFLKKKYPTYIGHKTTIQETIQETTQETVQETVQEIPERIIQLLMKNPNLTRKELVILIGKISDSGIKYHLKNLTNKGVIKHIGSTKKGHWLVLKKP